MDSNISNNMNASLITHHNSNAISWDDATWILTSSFIVFTMQTGFGLLESGCVQRKNEVSIMVKNCVDPLFSGLAYWSLGYGLSLTNDLNYKNPMFGWGEFLVDSTATNMGQLFASYTYRLSLTSTVTTIVSGAMAERITFTAYCYFSFFITIFFALPGYWVWSPNGFLRQLLAVDVAGCSTLHLLGGMSGLIATIILKPRFERFSSFDRRLLMSSPTNALLGTFMIWWGWLGLNISSTFGVSNNKWKYAARACVTTIVASSGGGCNGLIISYIFMKRKFNILIFICGLLSAMVSISGACTVYHPWQALVIGWIASSLSIFGMFLLSKLKIDDPINTISIHLFSSVWGMIAVALMVEKDSLLLMTYDQSGLLYGGSVQFLFAQLIAIVSIGVWSAVSTVIVLYAIRVFINIRLNFVDEIRGADIVEHNVSWNTIDDTLLPQSKLNKAVAQSYARRRLKIVLSAMRAIHRFSAFSRNSFIKKKIKENQTKALSISWRAISSTSSRSNNSAII